MSKKNKFRMSDHVGDMPDDAVLPTHVPVKLLYDTWGTDGARILAGTFMEMPLEVAKRLIEAGKVERADPLPGE